MSDTFSSPPRLRKARLSLGLAICAGVMAATAFALFHGYGHINRPSLARYPARGVDVSRHQGSIDWTEVARQPGVRFAYVKATEGGDWTDPRFADNVREAKRAGLLVGSYHFFTFCRPAIDQAEHFLAVVPHDDSALPAALDVEYAGNCHEVPPAEVVRRELSVWLEAVEGSLGKAPIIYATAEAYQDFIDGAKFKNALWMRSLIGKPKVEWTFWQYDARGTVKGIDGLVDLDVYSLSATALQALAKAPHE